MKEKYQLQITPSATKQARKLPNNIWLNLKQRIYDLVTDPFPPQAKKMQGYQNTYRIRYRTYRVIYEVQNDVLIILVLQIGHRREIYR